MRYRKDIQQAFYANGVESELETATITSIDSNYKIHYTQADGDKYWLSLTGTTSPVLEDSYTTAIVRTPTSFTGATGATYQIAVVNQNGDNVITECSFSGFTGTTVSVSTTGLMTLGPTAGFGQVTVYHVDPVSADTLTATIQTRSYIGSVSLVVTPSAATGTTTGQTITLAVVNENGINVKADCTFAIYADPQGIITSVNATTGNTILNGNNGTATVQATHIGGAYARATIAFVAP